MLVAALWRCMWGRSPIGGNGACSTPWWILVTPSATHNQIGPFWCCFLCGWVCVCSRPLWVSPMNSPVRLWGCEFLPLPPQPPEVFSISGLRLYFPELEPWVAGSVSSPNCSSPFICMGMWDFLLHQPPPHQPVATLPTPPHSTIHHLAGAASYRYWESSPLGCLSPPLLLVWMKVSSLTPWLSYFHTVRFSVSSGCFLFLSCCCPSFDCARRHSASTYASISARSPNSQ